MMGIKFTRQNFIYSLACLSGIIIFILFVILPYQRDIKRLDDRIAEISARLEEQKTLTPIYLTLKQRARKQGIQGVETRALPFPAKIALSQAQFEHLNDTLKEISGRANVEVLSIIPAFSSLTGDSKSMAMEASVRGDFFSFRRFLVGIGSLPYVEDIEELQIQVNSDGMELKVKFWIVRS